MSGLSLVLPLVLLPIAVALLSWLNRPEVPERQPREPEFDFGGSWLDEVPRAYLAPSYLTFPENEKPSELTRPAS